ncbi:unnamed protein product [Hermetia illucens]|uniref:Peptidase S1 domain-containing protein n=1 Tax=Hermetia illucens TaxID=343691 RepID=A0A7R8Z4R3_HERIL|nr:chymotrypsin-2-like [Hermetia illucens]CAD7093257.1 unnamed protein product [Hermetia illucens]
MTQHYLMVVSIWILSSMASANSFTIGVRIFGGEEATNPIPYQISLQKLRATKWDHFCGGSIISHSYIVTAAHCVYQEEVERLSILAGTTNRLSNSTRYLIQSYIPHPNYRANNHHDIALVQTKHQFQFTSNIAPINFEKRYYIRSGVRCHVSGWGVMERVRTAPFPEELQTTDLWTISNRLCRRFYNVSMNEICTFGMVDEGTCAGDSGGPLVSWDRSHLIGVVSYGPAYCGTGIPDVYTRISVFTNWIRGVIKANL